MFAWLHSRLSGWLRCCNDHLFLCPRHLCGPYATLIHNFNNSNCTPLPGYARGGDGVLPDGSIRPQPVRLAERERVLRVRERVRAPLEVAAKRSRPSFAERRRMRRAEA